MKKSTIAFAALNLLCVLRLVFFVLSTKQMAIMEDRYSYEFGDSLNFLFYVVPFLAVCLIANSIWLVMGCVEIYRRRNYRSAVGCAVVVVLWAAVFQVCGMLAKLPSRQETLTANRHVSQSEHVLGIRIR